MTATQVCLILLVASGTMAQFEQQVIRQPSLVTGGLTETRQPDEEAQIIANQVRGKVEELVGRRFTQYALQSYRTQVVSGVNYYMKMYIRDTQGEQYVAHLRINRPLRGTLALTGLGFPIMWNDPITFDGYTTITA